MIAILDFLGRLPSVARRGGIFVVADSAELVAMLEAFYREIGPSDGRAPWQSFFRKNYREKAVAFGVSALLWTALVNRSQTIQRSFVVPVNFNLLPGPLEVAACDPPAVMVTLGGQRKEFGFLTAGDVKLTFELLDAQPGRRSLPITGRDLSFPEGLELEDIEPRQVRIQINERPMTNGAAGARK